MRDIPDPGFAGDAGEASADVTAALAAYSQDPDALHEPTLAVVAAARLLVPVVAVAGDIGHDEAGLAHEKTTDMATVLTRGRDGRTALLAFTGTDSLRRWNPEARPVPVTADKAAQAALQDGAAAIVVDVAGPVMFVIEEGALRSLADGFAMVALEGRHAWVKRSV